jgi:hypothetical protein
MPHDPAAAARSTSAAAPSEMWPQTVSVAGLINSSVFGCAGSTHLPPI